MKPDVVATAVEEDQQIRKKKDKMFWRRVCFGLVGLTILVPTVTVAAVESQRPLHKLHHAHTAEPVVTAAPISPAGEDFYTCTSLGHNGCWAPSLPKGDGSPYMHTGMWPKRGKKCVVKASGDPKGDDAPAILDAFKECKSNGHIVFQNTTYYVGTVMNTTGLQGVNVEVNGTLLWNADIQYWLRNSLPVGFQNQTSAWIFGGDDVHFYGHGYGTLDGNGQVWYDYNQGQSNLRGRPHAITISQTTNSVIEGLRFVQSQMWTMTVVRSERVMLQDIYVNSSAAPGSGFRSIVNTDGVDVSLRHPGQSTEQDMLTYLQDRLRRQHQLPPLDNQQRRRLNQLQTELHKHLHRQLNISQRPILRRRLHRPVSRPD